MGKILRNKELGAVRSAVAAFPVDGLDALCTVPLWAFCFLGKGCSSQLRGIFSCGLWKRANLGTMLRCSVGSGLFELHFSLGSEEIGIEQQSGHA